MRIGLGYDVHRLQADRDLILGGVAIPHTRGLAGHSDADVLTHALMDSLLGAVGVGDIGQHFPDHDPSLAGISSIELLRRVMEIVWSRGYRVVNVDLVVVAQEPRLAPYRGQIQERLALVLDVNVDAVGIKATTTEGLGLTGRKEGIAAQAVVLLNTTQGGEG